MAFSGELGPIQRASGTDTDDGDYSTALVAAVTGKKIRVRSMVVTVLTTAGTVSFKGGSTTLFTAHLALGTPLVLPDNPSGWMETASGAALLPSNGSGVDSFVEATFQLVEP